jgi:hypothetical protein
MKDSVKYIVIIVLALLGVWGLFLLRVNSNSNRMERIKETFDELCSNLDANGKYSNDFGKCVNNICFMDNRGKSYQYKCNSENPEVELITDEEDQNGES